MDDIVVDFPRRPPWRREWARPNRRVLIGWAAVVGAGFGLLPLVAGSGPRDDVQVVANTTTAGSQSAPAVATLPNGKVVVVWEGAGADDETGIFARIRDPDTGFGTEFRVNEVTDGAQGEPAVAADATGDFLVAWSGPSADNGGHRDVFTRLFDATGTALRGEEVLNLQTAGDQSNPAVAAVGLQRFAVVFEGSGEEFLAPAAPVSPPAPVEPPALEPPIEAPIEPPIEAPVEPPIEAPVEPPIELPVEPPAIVEPPAELVPAQDPSSPTEPVSDNEGVFLRYTGLTTDAEQVLVNVSSTQGRQQAPAVAASGSTVEVVWSGNGPDDNDGVYATTVTGIVADPDEFLVNTTTDGSQGEPAVVAVAAGDFVAVWAGAGPGDTDGVFLRPLDLSVGEVLVNSVIEGDQHHPAVAVLGSGLLTVVWDGPGGLDTDGGAHAQRFDFDVRIGPLTTEIAVNSVTEGVQGHPVVAGNSQADYTVAFESPGTDGDVFVRRFSFNDPPDVVDDAYTVEEDSKVSGNVLTNDRDVDGDGITASKATDPSNGLLTLNDDGTFEYRPNANFNGQDRFTYRASDGTLNSVETAEVVLTIQSVNDGGPTAVADGPFQATEHSELVVTDPALGVLANDTDPDDDTLKATLVGQAASGSVDLAVNGTFKYRPPELDFCGDGNTYDDKFTYKASDEALLDSAPAEVQLRVSCVFDAPQAMKDHYYTLEDKDLDEPVPGVLLNDDKKDSAQMVAHRQTAPQFGELVSFNEDGSFIYRPNKDFHEEDSFSYAVTDASNPQPPGPGQVVTVTIEVGSEQDTPAVTDDTYLTGEDAELVVGADKGVLANDSDPDEGDLTARQGTPPSRGTLVTLNPDGSFTYQPNQDFNGVDVFTYEVANQSGKAATGRVTLAVGPQPDMIIATDDRYQLVQDVSLTVPAPGVLSNDVDPDGDKLGLSVVKDVAHGKLELNHDGSFLYAPAEGFTGSDGFTYKVRDSDGNEATADVAIVVRPAEKPPPDTTATTMPGPVAPPPPPPPPPKVEIKTGSKPVPTTAPKPTEPVVPITAPRIAPPPPPPTVAVLPAEQKKGSGLPVKPLAVAGGGGLGLAALLAGLKSKRRLKLEPVQDMPVD